MSGSDVIFSGSLRWRNKGWFLMLTCWPEVKSELMLKISDQDKVQGVLGCFKHIQRERLEFTLESKYRKGK